MAARIFISHSAKADESAQNFRDALIDQMQKEKNGDGNPRFDVLRDCLRMQPGAVWRNEIYTWKGLVIKTKT